MQGMVISSRRYRRRAAVIVQVAVSSTVVLGMGALAIDVGALYTAQTELQISADAAALAGAAELAGSEDVQVAALAAADLYAGLNKVLGMTPAVYPEDVEYGHAIPDPETGRFLFEPADERWDAFRVNLCHLESESPDDPPAVSIPLTFAQVFGLTNTELHAQSTAVLVPRDIALVIDLSNSMNWDSQTRFWDRGDGGYSNLRDIWCALDGPEPARPYIPGPEDQTEYATDTGPTYGHMTEWGDPLEPDSYNPASDPGLYYIRRYRQCTDPKVTANLQSVGYSDDEIAILMGSSHDSSSSHWRYRVSVCIGLATWNSGRPGGHGSGGDGDNRVESGELTWIPKPSYRVDWYWSSGYVNWMRSSSRHEFRYRYGLKTFTDFLLQSEPQMNETNNLWSTPQEPLRAVKDAVQVMIDEIIDLDSLDHAALAIFGTTSNREVDLTDILQDVPDRLYQMQSGHYNRCTNIGGGLAEAIDIFEREGSLARPSAYKIIMLMSDGKANIDANGNSVGDGAYAACQYARDQAEYAASQGYRIYTISVGYYVDRDLMGEIAATGGGQEFYASGDPATYSAELQEIFATLGGKRPVSLID
ncbi:MAG: VWA domain-containing protein [Phycisphaerae bacterium]|nr:VWA domain-containing protein [Phycisphaerae bacterium]